MPPKRSTKPTKAAKAKARQRTARRKNLKVVAKTAMPGQMKRYLTKPAQGKLTAMGSSLKQLAGAITLPSEGDMWRFPTAMLDTRPTALWHLTKTKAVDYSAAGTDKQNFMLSHCPLMPLWGTTTATEARQYFYRTPSGATSAAGLVPVEYNYTIDNNAVKLYPLRDDIKRVWSFVPVAAAWNIIVQNFTGTGHMFVNILVMGKSSDIVSYNSGISVTGGNGLVTGPAAYNGKWICIDFVDCEDTGGVRPSAGSDVIISVQPVANQFMPLFNMPAMDTLKTVYSSLRTNSAGLLMMNTSAPLYRNGGVNAARLSWDQVEIFSEGAAITSIGDINHDLKFVGKAAQGAYTFMIPTGASLNYSDYVLETVTQTGGTFVGDMRDYQSVNFVSFNVQAPVGTQFTLQLRYDAHLEAITDQQVWKLGVPLISYTEFAAIVEACAKLVPFTENPLHLVLLGLAAKVLRFLAPFLLPAAHTAIDMAANRIKNN